MMEPVTKDDILATILDLFYEVKESDRINGMAVESAVSFGEQRLSRFVSQSVITHKQFTINILYGDDIDG